MLKGHQLQCAAAGYTALLVAGVVARRAMLGVKSATALLRERRKQDATNRTAAAALNFMGLPSFADDRDVSLQEAQPVRDVSPTCAVGG